MEEDKLIIDKDLFDELTIMISSPSEDDVIMAISILENSDPWDRQNQQYKEKLYTTLSENKNFSSMEKNHNLKMKVWLAMNDLDDKGIE